MTNTTSIKRWERALQLWKAGVSTAEIGEQLGISQGHAAVLIVRGAERLNYLKGLHSVPFCRQDASVAYRRDRAFSYH